MSSTPSSSSSSAPPAPDIIDEILNTKADKPDFDLSRFVAQIDILVAHYEAQLQKKKPMRENLDELPSATDASNFADQVSTNVTLIANEIKAYSGNTHETSIRILNTVGSVHWVAVGFLMVGAVLQIADTIENNKEECLRLFKSMIELSKVILQLLDVPSSQKELHGKLRKSIQLIVEGAIQCCLQKKRKGLERIWKASKDKQELQQLSTHMEAMSKDLHLQISATTLKGVLSIGNTLTSLVSPPPRIPSLNHDAVGIENKIKEVIEELDWESDSATSAVVLYGVGGSGKTTLADAVYSSLKDKLHGWKYCRVTLIQSLEKNPKIEKIQSSILYDLTTTKHHVRDYQSGQQSLKEIIEKEPVFLYIDNALYVEPLEKLLPKDFTSAKKFRLLLTARETNVKGIIEYCRIEPCKLYDIGSLSIDGALEVLCRKIDRKKVKETILQERPKVREIAEKCCCCPLFLEVVGAYIHQRENTVDSYDGVLCWLESGDNFGGSAKYNFDESRVLFSYNELNSSSQEAFLDICSFFSRRWLMWEWEEVAYIVGEEEMKCLQEGALIKRDGKKIKIHDLILAAGRNKSKQTRIKCEEDFPLILKDKELASQVKGVWMKDLRRRLVISAEELDAMSQFLRIFYMGYEVKGKCSKQFDQLRFLDVSGGMCSLPIDIFKLNNLRYLSIHDSKEDVILSSSMNFPKLKVLKLFGSRIHGIAEIGRLGSLKQLELDACNADGISHCFPNLHNLQRLKLSQCEDLEELPEALVKLRYLERLDLSYCRNLKQLPAGFGGLINLIELNLSSCNNLKQLPARFGELTSLTELDLSSCNNLEQLPAGFWGLTSLTELALSCCNNLKQLPAGFGGLTNLTQLNLSCCSSLQELPCDLEKLTSLESLNIRGCSSLFCLPRNLGRLMSAFGSHIYFDGCSSLSELPEDICNNTMVTSISLKGCYSLKRLPSRFGELTCLQLLDLRECESLEELCNGFHCLGGLKELRLAGCKGLSSLPQNFGKLSSLETLDLSGCVKLKELSSDFHCCAALKDLNLSRCDSLCNLPESFGELSCLESLDLSGCSSLVKLSDDFRRLRSLTRLELCNCENLRGEWMDSVGNIRSLWCLDIVGSERMIQSWMEMKRHKKRSLVVVTDFPQGKEGRRALLLEGVLARVFGEEGLLLDADENPFHLSSLQRQNPIILIIDISFGDVTWRYEALRKNLQQLQENSKELQIIYLGISFKSLISSECAALKIVAQRPDNFRTSSLYKKLYACFNEAAGSIVVLRSTDQLEENNLNFLSAWEDMSSYMLDRAAFLGNTPRESNLELLKELLVTGETDYLLLSGNRQVKVAALQGKLILLLITYLNVSIMHTSALKEMYVKMQESGLTNNSVEVVWVPVIRSRSSTWEEFEGAAVNAPWPSVPDPWLIKERTVSFSEAVQGKYIGYLRKPFVCVVNEKGRISNKDAMAMIERWGVEAYPFSEARDEELNKAEWETIKLNSSSTLQFVFQNIEFLSNKAMEVMDRGGVMTLLCVGSPEKMIELAPHLNSALTTLGMEFNVLYVARDLVIHRISSDDYDKACEKLKENESETCGIATLSLSDTERFWRRIEYLRKDLMNGMGTDERILKVRRMVLGLASANKNSDPEPRVVVVDRNGEIISGRGMEVVKVLSDGKEDSKENLLEDIKMKGFGKSMESRWRDGIIHPKHHPQHPLLQLWLYEDIGCNLCSKELGEGYQCNVCENYVICGQCEECGRGEVRDGIDSV